MLSDDLRRFIQSLSSVPHLEAILLLRQTPARTWGCDAVAQRLYISDDAAAIMLNELQISGIFALVSEDPLEYQFKPANPELSDLIDQIAHYYSHNLIEVTNIIHSKVNRTSKVQQFADAFRFQRKDE